MKLSIFKSLQKPIKRFLASDKLNPCIDIEYESPDYVTLFQTFLNEKVHTKQLDNELYMGNTLVTDVISSLYQKKPFPDILKHIAEHVEQFPLVSDLLMTFYREKIDSVDYIDSYGETALAKILKEDIKKESSILFLVSHGAKHCTLSSKLQNELFNNYPNIYEQAKLNTQAMLLNPAPIKIKIISPARP